MRVPRFCDKSGGEMSRQSVFHADLPLESIVATGKKGVKLIAGMDLRLAWGTRIPLDERPSLGDVSHRVRQYSPPGDPCLAHSHWQKNLPQKSRNVPPLTFYAQLPLRLAYVDFNTP